MDIAITMSGVEIHLILLEVVVFACSIIVALAGLVTGLLARKIWMMVEGELAASWGWILPGFGIYLIASGLRVLSVFMSNSGVYPLVAKYVHFITPEQLSDTFLVFQAFSETFFLLFIVFGLARQYRLFSSLAQRDST